MTLSAVILAGGESRRMGFDKARLSLEGVPLLTRLVRMVRELGVNEIFISGRAEQDYSEFGCPVLLDLQPGLGPLGGIERGLEAANAPLVLVLAVDLPRMTTGFMQRLVAECGSGTGVVPKLQGQWEPLAAIYPKRCHAFVLQAIAAQRLSARDFAQTCFKAKAVRELELSAADAPCFLNCNTPGDLPP